jgi:hypothetical protein
VNHPSRRCPIRQALIVALGLVVAVPAAAAAQTPVQQTWTIDPLRAGYCIEFLVDSSIADRELPKGLVPVGAGSAPNLGPALTSAVAERPDSFSTWAPSELCFYWSQSVTVDGRQLAEKGDDVQAVGVWSILARPADDPAAAPASAAVKLFASNWRATGLGRAAHLDFERIEAAAGKVPVETADGRLVPGTDDRYQVKMGKTTLTWDGRLAGDSAAAPLASAHVWQAYGLRQTTWSVRSAVNAEGTRPVVGALRVAGKDALARALQASPIRFVGRWHSGGTAQIVFSR